MKEKPFIETSNEVELQINHVRINCAQPVFGLGIFVADSA